MAEKYSIGYEFYYNDDEIRQLERLQAKMLDLINTKSNWEDVKPTRVSQDIFAKIQDRQSRPKVSSKEVLGIQPSSRVVYSPLLLRSLADIKTSQPATKKLIPVQQALLEKYAAEWQEKAGADYPFVRLDNEQKVEFAHLTEGLNREEMSRYIVIDPKDHKMYSEKAVKKEDEKGKVWSPEKNKDEADKAKMKGSIGLDR